MIIPNVCSRQSHKGYTVHTRARRSLIAILILALITITGVVPAWADQHDVPFEATIERARTILVDHIAQHGAFEVTCLGGILVCRC